MMKFATRMYIFLLNLGIYSRYDTGFVLKEHRVFREGWMKRQKFLFIFVVLGAKIWQRSRGTIPPKLGTNGGALPTLPIFGTGGGSTARIFFQKICRYFWSPRQDTKHETCFFGMWV